MTVLYLKKKMFRIRSLVVLTFALLAPNVQEYISYIAKYAYLNHIVHFQNITSLSSTCCEICLNNFRERFCCGGEWEWKGHRPDDRAPEECRWLALKRKKKSGLIMKRPTWTGSNIRYVFLVNWQQMVDFLVPQVCPIDTFTQLPKAQLRLW